MIELSDAPYAPDTADALDGGCLCGAVRYRVPATFRDGVAHCHCHMCRRAAGAAAVTWFTVPRESLVYLAGTPTGYHSSDHGVREFCGDCGSPLTFWTSHAPDVVDVTLCTLDRAAEIPATRHIWTASRLPWLTLDPDLPEKAGDEEG